LTALLDGDNIAVAAAFSAGDDAEDLVAIARASDMVRNILQTTGAEEYVIALSGPTNYRYQAYPEYKANRLHAKRPKWEKSVRDYFLSEHQAVLTENCEADDYLGYSQTNDTIICHLDKDINMIPGWHFNWELLRKGKVVREARRYYVTEDEAIRFFYYQLLVGDNSTDNIKGVVGCGDKTATAILNACSTEQDMFNAVRPLYSCDEEMFMNAICLWIQREKNENIVERWEKLNLIQPKPKEEPSSNM